ncbi:ABC transporter substrate-binding protein [Flavobacteriaceae bacterium]|nr:ABC transporter substrate-binding protein [Flavobacteriaceae bacterium]
MVELKGIAWDHPRGYEPLIAASKEYEYHHPYLTIKWDVRSLREFGDMPIEHLIERYDLITIDHPYMGQADKNGLLLRLEAHLSEDEICNLEAQTLGGCFEAYSYNQHLYALPIDAAALVTAYRKDKMKETGLSLPKDREELKYFYCKIPTGYSVAWALSPTDIWCTFLSLCAQNAGSGFIKNRQIDVKVGGSVLDELKYHVEFSHPNSLYWNPIQILDRMGTDEDIIYSPYLFGYTNYSRSGYTKNLLHFTNSPIGAQENISTILGGVGLAVSLRCKNPVDAASFVKYIASAEIQKGIFTRSGGQPANKLAWQSMENNQLCNNFFCDTISTIEKAYIRPQHPRWNEFQEQGADLIHDGLLKDMSSKVVMSTLNELYQSIK